MMAAREGRSGMIYQLIQASPLDTFAHFPLVLKGQVKFPAELSVCSLWWTPSSDLRHVEAKANVNQGRKHNGTPRSVGVTVSWSRLFPSADGQVKRPFASPLRDGLNSTRRLVSSSRSLSSTL